MYVQPQNRRYRFGPFVLDATGLWDGGGNVLPPGLPTGVLGYLLAHAVQVVRKEQLLEACWARCVSEQSVKIVVHKLRAALDDLQKPHKYIETVPGGGYRFRVKPSVDHLVPVDSYDVSPAGNGFTNEELRAFVSTPQDGDARPHTVEVRGTYDGLPYGWELWVVKEPRRGNYHPDRGPAMISGDKFAALAFIGHDALGADTGVQFPIHIVACSHEIGRRYHEYLDHAHRHGGWMGLASLLGGIVLATVTVVRDDSSVEISA